MVGAVVVTPPDLEQCACADSYEAYVAAKNAMRVTALRSAAIRAYERRQRDFALQFVEEVTPGWDE